MAKAHQIYFSTMLYFSSFVRFSWNFFFDFPAVVEQHLHHYVELYKVQHIHPHSVQASTHNICLVIGEVHMRGAHLVTIRVALCITSPSQLGMWMLRRAPIQAIATRKKYKIPYKPFESIYSPYIYCCIKVIQARVFSMFQI